MTSEEKIKEEILHCICEYAGRKALVQVDKLFDTITSPQIMVMLVEIHHQRLEEISQRCASLPNIDKRSPDGSFMRNNP